MVGGTIHRRARRTPREFSERTRVGMVDSEVRARVGSRTDKTRAFLAAYS